MSVSPVWGELRVRCIEAEYDEEYLAGPPRTYCKLLLLETFKWRRRQHKTACEGLQPRWNDEFLFEDVCANSKLTIDVWNAADDPEEFLGKATIPLAEVVPARGGAPKAQVAPWFELMPGRVRLELSFRPPEFIEYTDRGGSGKENQDAYFVHRFDEKNAVLGVFDGHGPDHGKVAAWAAARAVKTFLIEHFKELATDPEGTMTRCFEQAHNSVFQAISSQPGVRVHQGLLVIDVDEEDWPLGYDAADGGTTASVAALLDGRTLVYAASGDSCSVLGVPSGKGNGHAVTELVPEHSPTNMHDWVTYLQGTGVHCVFDHEAMFDNQPHNLLPIFTPTPNGGWELAQSTMDKTKELGVGLKTARGDLAAVIMTPESGKFSQMMLGVTRSVGDFYHQTYGVTWRPEVVVKDLYAECMANDHSDGAVLIVASDGVWDHWTFDGCMEELLLPDAGPPGQPLTTAKRARAFFEKTRDMGEEAFGEGADNLTGVVVILPRPPPPPPTAPTKAGVTRDEFGA